MARRREAVALLAAPARLGRWLFGSVRVRTTLAVVVVVAATLAAGGLGLVWLVHRSLFDGLVSDASAEAAAVSQLVSRAGAPSPVPESSGVSVQIVDQSGAVVGASTLLSGRPSVSEVRPPTGTQVVLRTPPVVRGREDPDPDLTVATTVATPSGRQLTIYAVTPTQTAEHSTHVLILVLAVVLPILVAASGVFEWLVLGRALRPVEAIRKEVSAITAQGLHRRVPLPGVDDEIGRLADTMNEMLGRLEASTERQRQFVSDASHELRSPLAAIVTQLDVARAHPEAADWTSVADVVADEAGRLSRVVDDLLLLARSDEGHLTLRREQVDLDELVLAEATRLRAQGRVLVDLHELGAGRVLGDRDQLHRVVRNLADNAERYAKGTVRFAVRTLPGPEGTGVVELTVVDDGPGIPPSQRQRVFERFARLDAARGRPDGGTGLGLAIVGELVAAHHGTVEAADSDVGARIVVRFPPWTA